MERKYILTDKGRSELLLTRERVEAGDSSVFELSAQRLLLEKQSGKKNVLTKAQNLYETHNEIFSRRARIPEISTGRIIKMPTIVYDMNESIYPGNTNNEVCPRQL